MKSVFPMAKAKDNKGSLTDGVAHQRRIPESEL
jgi:hypothetical protein